MLPSASAALPIVSYITPPEVMPVVIIASTSDELTLLATSALAWLAASLASAAAIPAAPASVTAFVAVVFASVAEVSAVVILVS